VTQPVFVSYAQHGEDVVIWRALQHVPDGYYLDVGAAHPSTDSVTRALYERGWRGIHVEAMSEYAAALRDARAGDVVVEAAAGAEPGQAFFYAVPGTGLSTTRAVEATVAEGRGFGVTEVMVPVRTVDDILGEHLPAGREVHVMKVDVEGAEEEVLRGAALKRWRPWVVVVEATRPGATERTSDRWQHHLLDAGYVVCMFDGLNLWFRRDDHPELEEALSYPACPLDLYVRPAKSAAAQVSAKALQQAKAAKTEAERHQAATKRELERTKRRLVELQNSPWWRLTRPGRSVVHRLKKAVRRSRTRSSVLPAVVSEIPAVPAPTDTLVATAISESSPLAGVPAYVVVSRLRALLAADGVTDPSLDEAELRVQVRTRLAGPASSEWLWALHVVHTGSLADDLAIENLLSLLDLDGPDAVLDHLEASAQAVAPGSWVRTAGLDVLSLPVLEVTHAATHDLHTGIQRVVREAVPRWCAAHACELVVLDPTTKTYRRCNALERERVLSWPPSPATRAAPGEEPDTIVLPWRTRVIVPEIGAPLERADVLRGVAALSGNRVSVIAYDMTPVTRAENTSDTMPSGFSRFLSAAKHADRVSAISSTVAHEFRCFFDMLDAQGLTGPEVRTHALPSVPRHQTTTEGNVALPLQPGVPLVLSVSAIQPRKNHLRTLQAAEHLWRAGLRFELAFIGGGSGVKRAAFDAAVRHLRRAGRPVHVLVDVDDDVLWQTYRQARCTVYVSLVEGFGLPAVESLSVGTPVVLTGYGSMAEIGKDGGALLVDPRDVDAIAAAIRTLLLDDSAHAELSEAALQRPRRTWDDYARETWSWLVDGSSP
jgi:FkbM family methyltransferase